MKILKNKIALITGAAQGIGKSIAKRFTKEGALVIILDSDEHKTNETVREIGKNIHGFSLDITDQCSVEETIKTVEKKYGEIDILVNNAATTNKKENIVNISLEEWEDTIRTNITGTFIVTKAVLPGMIAKKNGNIINIASQLGSVATKNNAPYCTSKGAILQFTKALALDHALDGIRVNSISPGAVLTKRLVEIYKSEENVQEALSLKHPIGRIADPVEITGAAVFLASSDSSFVTGADLVVDGGYLSQ